jgi:tetratricopeptide (TPR) repeat protein
MTTRSHLLTFFTLAALALAATAGADTSPELVPIPELAFDGAEPRFVERVEASRARLAELDAAGVSATERAAAYGDFGRLCLASDLMAAAAAAFQNAAALAPQEHRWAHYLGVARRRAQDLTGAEEALRRAHGLAVDDLATLLRLGDVLLELNRPEEARRFFERAQQAHHPTAFGHYGLGKAAVAAEDWASAAGHFEKALRIDPEASALRRLLGLAYRELGDRERARSELLKGGDRSVAVPDPLIAELDRADTGANLSRAVKARRAGRLREAVELYRRAVADEPSNASHRRALGEVLLLRGERDAALGELRRAVELDPSHPRGHRQLGNVLLLGGRAPESVAFFRRATELAPGNAGTHLDLGRALAITQQHEEALTEYARAIDLAPAYAQAHALRARSLTRLERHAEAADAFREALALEPSNVRVRLALASARARLGHFGATRAILEEAPQDERVRRALVQLLATCPDPAQRDPKRAVELAVRLLREDATVQHAALLAQALAAAGEPARAVALQRQVVQDAAKAGAPAAELDVMRKALAYYESLIGDDE